MSVPRTRMLVRSFALVVLAGAVTNVSADDCHFAYEFCMPIYYDCIEQGGYQTDCIAMLDMCIQNNGCGLLP